MFTVIRLRKPSLKSVFITFVAITFLVGFSYLWAVKTVTIVDTNQQVEIRTFASTVEEVLQKQGVTYRTEDFIRPNPSTYLEDNMIVTIVRAIPIRVEEKDGAKTVIVAEPTVAKVIDLANIALMPLDVVEHNLDVEDEPDKYLKVIRIEEKTLEQTNNLDFSVKREPNELLAKGETQVVQLGEKGLVKETIVVTYVDGKESKREIVNREILKEPRPQIIAYGTKDTQLVQASRNLSDRKSLLVEATAYTHTGNKTATGINPYYGVIAVDPKVIPIGTKLYVEGYGYGEALDTGGSIKGNKIDVFFETQRESLNWGRRDVKVYIVE